jgi:hypothetical protein
LFQKQPGFESGLARMADHAVHDHTDQWGP